MLWTKKHKTVICLLLAQGVGVLLVLFVISALLSRRREKEEAHV